MGNNSINNTEFDFLIVGSGLFGAVFANEATKIGKKCLVIDKRSHIGGNVYTKKINEINVHYYGAHIFHTNDKDIWDYINTFSEFNRFTNSPLANYKGKLFNLPFNMNTFYQLWGITSPAEAKNIIEKQISEFGVKNPTNLEEQALSLVGKDIYEVLIKEYTEKQWGKKATELPSFIIKRLPLRYTFDNNYFNDKYQGIPVDGYTKIIEKMLEGSTIKLNTDYFSDRNYFDSLADTIIYTGKIDEFYDYQFGKLEYRSLIFDHQILKIDNFQGNAVVNYNDKDTPYTRVIEHKHFEFGTQKGTVITKEYPADGNNNEDPFYPINDDKNQLIYQQYKQKSIKEKNILFGGRLAEYRYYDMHQIIASALSLAKKHLKND